MIKIVSCIALLTILSACGQNPGAKKEKTNDVAETLPKSPENSPKKAQKTLSDDWKLLDAQNYTIQYPDTFNLSQSGKMETDFTLLSKRTSSKDGFRENINLIIQDLGGQQIDMDKYVEISEGQVKTMITDGAILKSERLADKNGTSHKVIFTGRQGILNLKWQQRYWIKNDKAFIITLTCEEKEFDNYISVGEKIINSFHIK